MALMPLEPGFWSGRNILVTGHTGFKGSWLLLMLQALGARVTGLALAPAPAPSMFAMIDGAARCNHHVADIRDLAAVTRIIAEAEPDVVLHLAAQPLVRASYAIPVATYATNLMGTVHVLEACRLSPSVRTIVSIATDKCYRNDGRDKGYRESDPLGGHDPYSNSKACAELASACYRDSFLAERGIGIATARAGNVIGGGDYSQDRLVPDAVRALLSGEPLLIRNPDAIRPWQHVLEPLTGYLCLAERLSADPQRYMKGWNFGPAPSDMAPVRDVIGKLAAGWGTTPESALQPSNHLHEAALLTLDSTAAAAELGWRPRLTLVTALEWAADWYRAAARGDDMGLLSQHQINHYLS